MWVSTFELGNSALFSDSSTSPNFHILAEEKKNYFLRAQSLKYTPTNDNSNDIELIRWNTRENLV